VPSFKKLTDKKKPVDASAWPAVHFPVPYKVKYPLIWVGLLVALTMVAYLPALHGSFVWDDDTWTTKISDLFQNVSGLRMIWFQPTAVDQYYPLTTTTFWLDYQLWKFWTLPYHLENVLWHALAALLFWKLLLRLNLPAAWLAAALFALHPIMVESVAWICERKNVLSLVPYLGALLAYDRFAPFVNQEKQSELGIMTAAQSFSPQSRPRNAWRYYCLAWVLFLAALLAKTTTFSLPAVILLLVWWQHGRLQWRADVLPTLPFFTLSLGLCAVTHWMETNHVGAGGSDFAFSWPQRCLIAGHVFWFYLGKLIWPVDLCFVYPRWQLEHGRWWEWVSPATAIVMLATIWCLRKRIGRGPITALLFYLGALFPVLGFMNVYYMRYSFVCDHWVYIPSLGFLAMVAVLVARTAEKMRARRLIYGFAIIFLPVLGLLTWQRAHVYRDLDTLWRDTLAKNPNCWMAHHNLGSDLFERGQVDEALEHFRDAVALYPDGDVEQGDLGMALMEKRLYPDAFQHLQTALAINPKLFPAHNNLALALADTGELDQAVAHFRKALQLQPNALGTLMNLGSVLDQQGKRAEAIACYRQAAAHFPAKVELWRRLTTALLANGENAEAVAACQQALHSMPGDVNLLLDLGNAFVAQTNYIGAAAAYRNALIIDPANAGLHFNLGMVFDLQGNVGAEREELQTALKLKPDFSAAAWQLMRLPTP
jgi:tetratricopeptide (TPR) repeat protein